ncbi:MAG TPA: hypothetical protein VLU46_09355 [Thermoanaerobaculia bacterium]|nr:hypothetical protein [Thermoanaerobaculia bacterium]
MARNWTVEVDGQKHSIAVDCDPQSHRASIRVDGRMAAKPMSAEESERDVQIGSTRYTIRRLPNDEFDLDIAPEVFLNRMTAGATAGPRTRPGAPPKQTSHVMRWIGAVVLALLAIGLVRYGARGFQYMRVPWQPYAERDGSFKAKFPSAPEETEQTQNINGDLWNVRSRYAHFKDHFYAVQYLDLKMVVVEANAEPVMHRFIEGWAAAVGGKVATAEKTSMTRNQAVAFKIALPAGAGDEKFKLPVPAVIRGRAAIRGDRLFLAWTLTAAADPFATDLRQFMEAFEIAPPPPPVTLEAVLKQPRGDQPASVQASVVAPEAPKKVVAASAADNAARLAAEPQIYLEATFSMYHVDGCKAVNPSMQRVAREQLPRGYAPHICVPPEVRDWRRPRN